MKCGLNDEETEAQGGEEMTAAMKPVNVSAGIPSWSPHSLPGALLHGTFGKPVKGEPGERPGTVRAARLSLWGAQE